MFKVSKVSKLVKMSITGLLVSITMVCPMIAKGEDEHQVTPFVGRGSSNNREGCICKWRNDLKWFNYMKASKNRRVSPDITNDRISLNSLKFVYDNSVCVINDRIRESRIESPNFLVDLLRRFIEEYKFDGNTASFTGLFVLTVEYLSYLKGKCTVVKFTELHLNSFCDEKSSISFAGFKKCLISVLSGR